MLFWSNWPIVILRPVKVEIHPITKSPWYNPMILTSYLICRCTEYVTMLYKCLLQICHSILTSRPLDHLLTFRTFVSPLHFWTRKLYYNWKSFSSHDGDDFLLCWWAILIKISPPDELVSTIPILPSFIFFPRLPSINFFPLLPPFKFFPLCTFQTPLSWVMMGQGETKSTCLSLSHSASFSCSFDFYACQSFWLQTNPFCQMFQVRAERYFGLDKGVR